MVVGALFCTFFCQGILANDEMIVVPVRVFTKYLGTWGSAGAWGSAGQTVSIFAFFYPLSGSASGRSGFASKSFLPLEMS